MSSILDPDYTFTSLGEEIGLDYRIRKGLARLGHVRPTLVQSKCLSLAINSGRDLLVRARTGSGKTLAYCIPVLHKILIKKSSSTNNSNSSNSYGVSAIIIVPTRELCSQVNGQITKLAYYCDDVIKTTILSIGSKKKVGQPKCDIYEYDQQEISLRDNPDIIIATPGGILAHIRSGALTTAQLQTSVETLVIDEADLVLSFGTSNNDLSDIVKVLPRIYQGFLMSATLSPELDTLKKVVLNSPITLRLEQDSDNNGNNNGAGVGVDSVNTNLKQFYIPVPKSDRNLILYVFIKLGLLKGKGIFFVNTTDSGYRLKLFLEQFHIRSCVLNAELPFRSRINIIEQFNLGNFDYLIATDTSADASSTSTGKTASNATKENDEDDDDDEEDDNDDNDSVDKSNKKDRVQGERRKSSSSSNSTTNDYYGVSRGMDFYKVSFVVNYDIPPNARSYAHRIGRTARGGSKGVALTFVDNKSVDQHSILESIHESQPKISISDASTTNLQASVTIGTSTTSNESNIDDTNSYKKSQPVLLDFNLQEVEGFRYRVEDVQRAVTRTAVRETRAAEIKAEILNSDKLQSHFEENTADLQLLLSSSDRIATNTAKVQKHLKHIPNYLLPRGMRVAANLHKKKRKRQSMPIRRSRDNNNNKHNDDPLRNYDGNDVNLDSVQGYDDDDNEDRRHGGNDDDESMSEFWNDDDDNNDDNSNNNDKKRKETKSTSTTTTKIYANTKDGTGRASMSGRKVWQMKHKKGDFSNKKRKSDYKYKEPLGI